MILNCKCEIKIDKYPLTPLKYVLFMNNCCKSHWHLQCKYLIVMEEKQWTHSITSNCTTHSTIQTFSSMSHKSSFCQVLQWNPNNIVFADVLFLVYTAFCFWIDHQISLFVNIELYYYAIRIWICRCTDCWLKNTFRSYVCTKALLL